MSSYNQYTYKRKQDEEDMDERDKAETTKALNSDSRIVPKYYEALSEALAEQNESSNEIYDPQDHSESESSTRGVSSEVIDDEDESGTGFEASEGSTRGVNSEVIDDEDESGTGSEASDSGRLWWPDTMGIDVDDMLEGTLANDSSLSPKTPVGKLNHALCIFCRVFFDTWTDVCEVLGGKKYIYELETAHYDTINQLQTSARRGCQLCELFISMINMEIRKYKHSISGLFRSEIELEPKGIMFLFYLSELGNFQKDCWRLGLRFKNKRKDRPSGLDFEVTLIPHKVKVSELRDKEVPCYLNMLASQQSQNIDLRLGCNANSLLLARDWLEECRTTHEACQHKDQDMKPTRLIRIEGEKIRLCLTTEQDDCSIYATLSHCWGKRDFLRLLKSNFSDFLDNIPYDSLSKTFRDAIDIAKALGFSWIWIDSLCIIQDDPNDWYRESSFMASMYGLSGLNLAATAAPDGTLGCLFQRDPIYVRGHHIEVETGNEKRIYDCADTNIFYRNIFSAPLMGRAWVVQERLLAPRTLHFTASQVFWECGTKYACETFPDQIPTIFCVNENYLPTQELWKEWKRIVELYSGCNLSFPCDRLVAIAGVARKIGQRTGDHYIAGLWAKNFENDLCWSADYDYNEPMVPRRGVKIPSWSWAAIDGLVSLPLERRRLQVSYINILDIRLASEGCDPFGSIKEGILTVSSKFMISAIAKRDLRSGLSTISIGDKSIPGRITWDYSEYQDHIYMFLPLGIIGYQDSSYHRKFEGLLLKETGVQNGQYERVGKFQREYQSFEVLDLICKELLEDLKTLVDTASILTETDYDSVEVDKEGVQWYTITII